MDKTDSIDGNFSSLINATHHTISKNGVVNEAENMWSADIEESFLEALAIYPPCGRRKIILTEEGKMYGRNELVARYIKIRTGKIRTRKQVSSHLQVLAKRRSKDLQVLRNDKHAQKIILERLKRYTSAETTSMNGNDKQDEQKDIDILNISTIPIKNLPHSFANNEHSNTISQSSTNIEQLKFNEDTCSAPTNNMIAAVTSSHMPMIKKSTKTQLKSNDLLPNVINNSVLSCLPTSPLLNSSGTTSQSHCSSNVSSSLSPLSCGSVSSTHPMINNPVILPLAIIGDENFRLYELSAFIELKRTIHSSVIYPYSETCSTYQHNLLRLHADDIQIKNLLTFETISIDQIFDKFPRYDGLKDLFERNPNGSFFLIKFWADVSISSSSITNTIIHRDESFFTSYTYTSCLNRPIHISTRLYSFGKQVLEKVDISEYPQRDQFDQFIYRFHHLPLCDYMVQFIQKLRSLPNTHMMNSVLENFTMLQVIKSQDNSEELLLCLAFVFEIAGIDSGGPQYQVYKLVAC